MYAAYNVSFTHLKNIPLIQNTLYVRHLNVNELSIYWRGIYLLPINITWSIWMFYLTTRLHFCEARFEQWLFDELIKIEKALSSS